MEKWKQIKGYEGLYKVSNTGKIKDRKGNLMKERDNGNGYSYACLWKNGKDKYIGVHRLVAIAFIKNPLNKKCVNHIDANKKNNNVFNLEWCTVQENCKHTIKVGHSTKGIKNPMAKLTEREVAEIRKKYFYFPPNKGNSKQLSKEYRVSQGTIVNIGKNYRWKHVL